MRKPSHRPILGSSHHILNTEETKFELRKLTLEHMRADPTKYLHYEDNFNQRAWNTPFKNTPLKKVTSSVVDWISVFNQHDAAQKQKQQKPVSGAFEAFVALINKKK